MAGGFEELGLAPELIRAVKDDLGYLLPTNVQDEAIPLMLGGGDVMVAAETGSGKTAAFSLPLLQIIHEDIRRFNASKGEQDRNNHSRVDQIATGWRISSTTRNHAVAVSPDGLACQSREAQWTGAKGSNGMSGGDYFFEAKVDDEGLCRFGWSTQRADYNLGTDCHGYGFGGTGMKSNAGQFEQYGEAFSKGDVVGCRLNLHKRTVSFTKNGKDLGVAYVLPQMATEPFFPAVSLKNAQASFNFKASWAGGKGNSGSHLHGSTPLASALPEHIVSSVAEEDSKNAANSRIRTPRAIILEPSKELAEQVSDCLATFKKYFTSPIIEHTLLVGGGSNVNKTVKALTKFSCDVVVGTPGRILDLIERGALKTSAVKLFVLDEADRLLATESLHGIMKIHEKLPFQGVGDMRLQVCFFSATLHSPEIARLAESICHRPTWVDLKGKDAVPDTVHHVVVRVDPDKGKEDISRGATVRAKTDKAAVGQGSEGAEEARAERLKLLKPHVLLGIVKALDMDQAMIFCRTNLDCDLLEQFLLEVGGGNQLSRIADSGKESSLSCRVLAGMRPTHERRANLQAFKEGYVRFLICTDVAARGVDVKGLPYVVNMTLPDEPENYIHRIGRVGRQDCMGLAVSIVAADGIREKVWFHKNCADRGRGCTNRELLERGGCTIWYDEANLLGAVEKRLGEKIPELGQGYSLPENLRRTGSGGEASVEYGSEVGKGGGISAEDRARIEAHVQSLKPAVRELAGLEIEAQNIWLGMMQGCF